MSRQQENSHAPLPIESIEQKERDNKFIRYLKAVGEEKKLITFLTIVRFAQKAIPQRKFSLEKELAIVQGLQESSEKPEWAIDPTTCHSYAREFYAAGMLQKTQEGIVVDQYALQMAIFLGEFRDKYPGISLTQLFGTNSHEIRLKIYKKIAKEYKKKKGKIFLTVHAIASDEEVAGDEGAIGSQLKNSSPHIFLYHPDDPNSAKIENIKARIDSDREPTTPLIPPPEYYHGMWTLRVEVIEKLYDLLSYEQNTPPKQLMNQLASIFDIHPKTLNNIVYATLKYWRENEYIVTSEFVKDGKNRSYVESDIEHSEMLCHLTDGLEASFTSMQSVTELTDKTGNIVDNIEKVQQMLQKAKKTSNVARRASPEEITSAILIALIENNRTSLSTAEISDILGYRSSHISRFLNNLHKQGQVALTKVGTEHQWSWVNKRIPLRLVLAVIQTYPRPAEGRNVTQSQLAEYLAGKLHISRSTAFRKIDLVRTSISLPLLPRFTIIDSVIREKRNTYPIPKGRILSEREIGLKIAKDTEKPYSTIASSLRRTRPDKEPQKKRRTQKVKDDFVRELFNTYQASKGIIPSKTEIVLYIAKRLKVKPGVIWHSLKRTEQQNESSIPTRYRRLHKVDALYVNARFHELQDLGKEERIKIICQELDSSRSTIQRALRLAKVIKNMNEMQQLLETIEHQVEIVASLAPLASQAALKMQEGREYVVEQITQLARQHLTDTLEMYTRRRMYEDLKNKKDVLKRRRSAQEEAIIKAALFKDLLNKAKEEKRQGRKNGPGIVDFVNYLQPKIYGILKNQFPNVNEIQLNLDFYVQECIVRIYLHLENIYEEQYIYSTALHLGIDKGRRQKLVDFSSSDTLQEDNPHFEFESVYMEEQAQFESEMQQILSDIRKNQKQLGLSNRELEVFIATRNLSIEETAQLLHLSHASAKQAKYRAEHKVRANRELLGF